jgi:hypothetical protein
MKAQLLFKSIITGLLFFLLITSQTKADRIYILPGTGYDQADPALQNAIASNGHTVVAALSSSITLPAGFTSTYIDPVNGYDWLCIFGVVDYSGIMTQVKAFIDVGGKVYYQHEVSCCVTSSTGAAAYAASFTGFPIVPNINSYIAIGTPPAWIGANIDSCVSIMGNAYKGMDSVPLANQIKATANLGGSSPSITLCENFGMFFSTSDFVGTAHKGAFVSLGDVNLWYDGEEPPNNGGSAPVNMHVINYFFPNDSSTCFLFPPGPIGTTGINSLTSEINPVTIYFNSLSKQIEIKSSLKSHFQVSVFNCIGQQVYSLNSSGSETNLIDAKSFSKGIYFVKLMNNTISLTKKLLIN